MRSRTRYAAAGAVLMTLMSAAACLGGGIDPIAFGEMNVGRAETRGADIGDAGARDRFLNGLPATTREKIRPALQQAPGQGTRRLGFVFSGCQAPSATLTITPERVHAEQEGNENAGCGGAEYFVAVFDVEASNIPSGAKLG